MIFSKKIIMLFFSIFVMNVFYQKKQEIKKPSDGKSLVYFIRPTAVAFLVDFKIFHRDKFISNISSKNYITYNPLLAANNDFTESIKNGLEKYEKLKASDSDKIALLYQVDL